MPDALVLVDLYRYHKETGDLSSEILEATKGEKITVSADELERGLGMTPQALAKPSSKEAKALTEPDAADEPVLTKPDGKPVNE